MPNNFRFYAKADVLAFLQQLPRGERSTFINEAVKRHRGAIKRKRNIASSVNIRPDIPIGWVSPKGCVWNGQEFVDP
jgi:hypothetical protein